MITAQQYIYNSKKEKSFVTSLKHTSSVSNGKKVSKEGDVYILLNISSEKDFVPNRFSRFVLDSILDGYLYSNSKSANESVKDAVSEGVNKIKELIKNDKDLSSTGIDVSFTVLVFKKEGAYVGVFGENEVFLFKKEEMIDIGEIIAKKKATTVGIVLKESDILIVSTKEKMKENMVKISRLKNAEDVLNFLKILGESLSQPSGFLYFRTKKEEEKKSIVEEKVEDILPVAPVKKDIFGDSISGIKKVSGSISNKVPKISLVGVSLPKIVPFFQKIGDFFGKLLRFFQKKIASVFEYILSRLKNKRWFKKIGSKMSEIKIPGRPSREGMRIDEYKFRDVRGKRFKIILVALLVIVLIAFGINFTINKKKERETSRYANERFVQMDEFLNKVDSIWRSDRSSAETYLFKVEKLLGEIPSELTEADKKKEDELEKKYLALADMLYRRVGVSEGLGNMSKYVEARLAFGEGSSPTDIDIYMDKSGNEYLVVSDKDRNAVHRISLYDKSVKTLPDENKALIDPEYISVGVGGVYVFDSKVGMVKAPFDESSWFTDITPLSGLSTDDLKAKDIVEMIVLTESDNVYLLSRDLKTLLKSTPAYGDRYGLSYPYLEKEEFSQANDVFSDLSVYITTSLDPKLVRYNYSYVEQKQAEAPLTVGGFDGNYGNLTKGFTRGDLKKGLYIFDSENRRIFKFEKPLEGGGEILHPDQIVLLNQYAYRGDTQDIWGNVKDIVVDEKEENMYVLDGSVIWKVSL